MNTKYFTALLALLALTSLSACDSGDPSKKEYPVSGTVTFDGKPIDNGSVLFRATEGDQRGFSGAIANGKYDLKAMAGKMKVQITASRPVPGKFDESNPGEKVPVGEMYIPPCYNTLSELTADVKAGNNTFNFDLKSDAKPGGAKAAEAKADPAKK